jgi:hypothetical protein
LLAEKKLDETGAGLEHSPQNFLCYFVILNFALLPKRTLRCVCKHFMDGQECM